MNRLQSVALLSAMGTLLGLLGWLLWGVVGLMLLLVVGVIGVAINPSTSPLWVMKLYGASRINPRSTPGLWRALMVLSDRAGLPKPPDLYYLPSGVLNAFAVGAPARSAVALTDGLMRQMSDREILGVVAHEISHIANNDLWVMGLADIFSRTTSVMSLLGQLLLIFNLPLWLIGMATINWWAIALLILAPHLSALAQFALSRNREYDADLNAAFLTGDPQGLASALLKIEAAQGGWLERIFLPGRGVPEPSLLRTHPETADRVARLAELSAVPSSLQGAFDRTRLINVRHQPVSRAPRWHISGLWH